MTQWNAVRAACRTDHPHAETSRRRGGFALLVVGCVLALGACGAAGGSSGGGDQAVMAEALTAAADTGPGGPQVDVEPGGEPTPSGEQPRDPDVSRTCDEVVGPGFVEKAQVGDDAGVSSFWARGESWVVCDVAGGSSAQPVLLASASHPRSRGFDEQGLAVSATTLTNEDGSGAVRFVAGGRLPWPLSELTYRFPDGHTERARFVTGGDDATWWSMTYTVTEGPLADAGVADPGPITVAVVGDTAEAFRLPWRDVRRDAAHTTE